MYLRPFFDRFSPIFRQKTYVLCSPGHINGSKPYKNVNFDSVNGSEVSYSVNFDSVNVFERGSSVNFDSVNGSCCLNAVNALTFNVNVLTL